jgi:Kelch motif
MKTTRCAMCALSDSKSIFVLGGYNDSTLKSVEKYDALAGKWEDASPMIYERFMHSAILIRMQAEEKVVQNI